MTQPELSRLLHEVGAVPAPAADYGSVVRASVARARLVRTGVLAGAALALVGALVGTAVALSGGGGPDTVAQDPDPTPVVTPSEEPTPTDEPSPTLEPTVEPTQEPTPTPAATTPAPVATTPPRTAAPVETTTRPVTSRPSPKPVQTTKSPTPKPYAAKGASVSVSYRVLNSETHRVEVTVTVRDNDGYLLSGTLDWAEGPTESIGAGSTTCGGGGRDPQPSTTTKKFTRNYPDGAEGRQVVARVTTGSSCRDTPRESVSGSVFVTA